MDSLKLERVEKGVSDDLVALQNVNSGNLSTFCVENPFTSGLIGQWAENLESQLVMGSSAYSLRAWYYKLCERFECDLKGNVKGWTILYFLLSTLLGIFVASMLSSYIFSFSAGSLITLLISSTIVSVGIVFSVLATIDLKKQDRKLKLWREEKKVEFEQKVARLGSDPVFFIQEVTVRLNAVYNRYNDHHRMCKGVFVNAREERASSLALLKGSLKELQAYTEVELPSRKYLVDSLTAKIAGEEASITVAESMESSVEARLGEVAVQLRSFRRSIDAFEALKSRFETQEYLLTRIREYVGISPEDWEESAGQQHQAQLQLVMTALNALDEDVRSAQDALQTVTLMIPERATYVSELTR